MGDVIKFKRKTSWQKHKGKSLCREGFHKWKIMGSRHFDVKEGKLVTTSKCQRCGKEKIELT